MPAYVLADVTVTDLPAMEEYRKQVPATLAKYGGRFLVRGGAHQTVEGDWKPTRLVVIEFPSLADARRWYDSEEYRAPKALRMRAGRTSVVIVDGVS
ncbi:MAG TPA: DUF1330 domain-containing protein [Methylomirabilota bacterium]|jgi:uncharacterized protein (DUF1330 family)|nr:DUF1330 domain-containing protein [Methylomirabilota bacterium]